MHLNVEYNGRYGVNLRLYCIVGNVNTYISVIKLLTMHLGTASIYIDILDDIFVNNKRQNYRYTLHFAIRLVI